MKVPSIFKLVGVSAALLTFGSAGWAETADDSSEIDESELIEEIVVTGSRIRRDEFSSAAPVQIIDGAASREIGLIDTVRLLQNATQATGTQIDSSFTAFVLDNGPGSAQVNLRGLGPDRVLWLVNGRRLAPGGVGGAPSTPDITTIPNIMIDRIELVLDGASSIYGSDAVSGVGNVIMRKDFEGFEFESVIVDPSDPGGEEKTLGLAWGKSGDNWNVGAAAEYYDRETLSLEDRDFTSQCNRYIHEDENGRELNNYLGLAPGTTLSPCKLSTINRVFIPLGFGNVWSTPGTSNIGIPNFSETEVPVGLSVFNPTIVPTDTNGDGIPDIGLVDPDFNGLTDIDLQTDAYNFNGSPRDRAGDLISENERVNVFAYGEYDLQDEANTTFYFETLYSQRKLQVFSPGATIFPEVPASNPYNPCNRFGVNGVNCINFFGGFDFGDLEVTPIVAIRGDRDNNDVELKQYRYVGGVKGDLPLLQSDGGFGNWSYDFYVSHSISNGTDSAQGILGAPLNYAINTAFYDPVADTVRCGTGNDGCVPVNMFADSIYQPGGGDFATQAERDYVFGTRAFETDIYQTIVSAVVQGDVFQLPWNDTTVPLVIGVEYRNDEIDSQPNEVARDGGFIAFFADRGAKGDRSIKEFFMETELQLLQDVPGAKEWSLNLAGRWTDESTYGSDSTYSIKTIYSPIDQITFRGTYGTSFRAPNAREQFLRGTSGFTQVLDPCVVPVEAQIASLDPSLPAVYDPTNDPRSATTLSNCLANGVDGTSLGLDGGLNFYSTEVLRKGGQQVRLGIDPETSTSYTYGVVLDPGFGLRVGVTYFDIEVEDSISLLGTQFIVNDCYIENENNSSQFCRFINRDDDGFFDIIDSSFVNINTLTSRGLDFNLYFATDFVIADRNLGIEVDATMTRLLENAFRFEDLEEDDAGTPVAPEWEGELRLTARFRDYRFNWLVNYISGESDVKEDFGANAPCEILTVQCRPVVETDYYVSHDISFTWAPRDWTFTVGMVNIFNEEPPLVDTDAPEVQLNNIPLGAGYDILGRRIFASVRKSFGGL